MATVGVKGLIYRAGFDKVAFSTSVAQSVEIEQTYEPKIVEFSYWQSICLTSHKIMMRKSSV